MLAFQQRQATLWYVKRTHRPHKTYTFCILFSKTINTFTECAYTYTDTDNCRNANFVRRTSILQFAIKSSLGFVQIIVNTGRCKIRKTHSTSANYTPGL